MLVGTAFDGSNPKQPPGMVIKPCKFLINYRPQLVSLPDFWTINSMTGWGGDLSYLVQAFLWRSRIFCMAVLRVLGHLMREIVSPASYFPPTSTVWTSEISSKIQNVEAQHCSASTRIVRRCLAHIIILHWEYILYKGRTLCGKKKSDQDPKTVAGCKPCTMLGTSEPLQLKVAIDVYIWVFPKIGIPPKMDGESNGKPYEQMDDLGGKPHYSRKHPYIPRTQIGPLVLIGISALFWGVDLQK